LRLHRAINGAHGHVVSGIAAFGETSEIHGCVKNGKLFEALAPSFCHSASMYFAPRKTPEANSMTMRAAGPSYNDSGWRTGRQSARLMRLLPVGAGDPLNFSNSGFALKQ
jgi:hypothetical protein